MHADVHSSPKTQRTVYAYCTVSHRTAASYFQVLPFLNRNNSHVLFAKRWRYVTYQNDRVVSTVYIPVCYLNEIPIEK
jgi:hypothetical protein